MNYLRSLLVILGLIIFPLAITSCGSDKDENEPTVPISDKSIIGTWVALEFHEGYGDVTHTLIFRNDGRCVVKFESTLKPVPDYSMLLLYSVTGILSDGADLKIWGSPQPNYMDFDVVFNATIVGSELTVKRIDGKYDPNFEKTYTRVK